jgi:ligand-binding sensor domain-containing protein
MRYDSKRNCIWINSNDGLVQFTLGDKKFHDVDAIDKLPSIKGYDTGLVHWHWLGIDMDTQGRVWSATVEKGIIVYDPSAQTAFQPVEDNDDTGHEISDKNAALYCDRDGIVWTSNWSKGIYELLPYSQSVSDTPPIQQSLFH